MKGLTLIELLVVLSIILILAGIIVASLPRFHGTAELESTAEQGISLLLEARAKTLSSQAQSQYGVHFETGRVILFKGTSFIDGDPNNEVATLSSRVEISSISLNGGGSDIVFNRLTGATDQYGTVTLHLVSDPTRTRTIRVLGTGGISLTQGHLCEWALFADGAITIGGGSSFDSYNSGGAGGSGQARVQTNSTQANTVVLGNSVSLNGTVVVGPGGNPSQVVTIGGGSTIIGGMRTALEAITLRASSPPSPPNTVSPIAPIPDPTPSGSPVSIGSGQTVTINICTNVPSEIVTGNNVNLTLQGDCPLVLNQLVIGGGSGLTVSGNVGEVRVKTISIGNSVPITFSSATTMSASDYLSIGGGSSFTVNGALSITTPLFTIGNSVPFSVQGNATFLTNTLSLGGGSSFTVNGALTVTSQSTTIGNSVPMQVLGNANVATNLFSLGGGSSLEVNGSFSIGAQTYVVGNSAPLQAQGPISINVNSFSLGGGSSINGSQSIVIHSATDLTMGNSVAVNAGTTLRMRSNTASIGGGSTLRSLNNLPRNTELVVSGTSTTALGNSTSFTGVLYTPRSPVSIGGGSSIRGQVIGGNSVTLGNSVSLLYDIALSNEICTP